MSPWTPGAFRCLLYNKTVFRETKIQKSVRLLGCTSRLRGTFDKGNGPMESRAIFLGLELSSGFGWARWFVEESVDTALRSLALSSHLLH